MPYFSNSELLSSTCISLISTASGRSCSVSLRALQFTSDTKIITFCKNGSPVTGVKMLDVNRALLLINHPPKHAHAFIHIVAEHVVRYSGQDSSLHVHLELFLGPGSLQTNGE